MSDEVERLRLENERLKAEVAEAHAPGVPRRRLRRWTAAGLAFLTALLLVLTVVAGWTSRTALDTDKFVARVGPVIDQPEVRAAVSTELTNELVTALSLQTRLQPLLPDKLTFLAGPIAAGAEQLVGRAVTRVVNGPAFHKVWYAALTLSHQQVVRALTGSNASVQIINGEVVVDLTQVVTLVLQNLSAQLPTIFGTAVSLQIPDNLPIDQVRSLLSTYLGVQLPDSFARIPVLDATALEQARTGVKVINLSVVLLVVLTVLALILAILASVNRRRTLLQVGLWSVVLTALVFFAARAVTASAIASIHDDVLRPAIQVAVRELFSSLRGLAALIFWVGLVLAVVMYLAGPGRFPVWLRAKVGVGVGWTTTRVREIGASEGYASWTARHLDALRVGGAVVAALLLLWLSSWTALLVIAIVLALYEVGVTLYARSTPDAAAEVDATSDGDPMMGAPS